MSEISSVGGAANILANQREHAQALREVASGSKLNRAADGAAQLALSAVLQGDRTVLAEAATNAAHGASVAQVADGGLARISEGLTRLRELAAAATSGAVGEAGRAAINAEFIQVRDAITETAGQTRFNGESLLDNGESRLFQVGTEAGDTIALENVDATADGLGIAGLELASLEDAAAALGSLDGAFNLVAEARADLGGTVARFEQRGAAIASQQDGLAAAHSSLSDADLAGALARGIAGAIQDESAIYARAQGNQTIRLALGVLP